MIKRSVDLALDPAARRVFCQAIRRYAAVAYPPGGSECAQVARETLLNTVQAIEATPTVQPGITLPKRQLAMLTGAVEWCGENDPDIDRLALDRVAAAIEQARTKRKGKPLA